MSIRLTRRLTLEAKSAGTDGAGGRQGAWVAIGTHWAEVRPGTGRQERGEEFARSRVSYRITIRAVPPGSVSRPEPGQRFREGDRVFGIRAVADLTSEARHLLCFADEEIAA